MGRIDRSSCDLFECTAGRSEGHKSRKSGFIAVDDWHLLRREEVKGSEVLRSDRTRRREGKECEKQTGSVKWKHDNSHIKESLFKMSERDVS